MKLTFQIIKGEDFFVGTIIEIPEVITQGVTIEETKENLFDALAVYLESLIEF